MMLTGCKDYDGEVAVSNDPVMVELAYTFSSSVSGTQTRQADAVVQNTSNRIPNPSSLCVIGTLFDGYSHELMRSETIFDNMIIDRTSEPQSLFFHSIYCNLPTGVNDCLVYGAVDDATPTGGIDSKVYNGSLIPSRALSSVTSQRNLQDLTFKLESIYESTTAPTEAETIAGYLTAVANTSAEVSGSTVYWKNSTNIILKNLFNNFTNHGEDLAGSAATVKQWLLALAKAAQDYISDPPSAIESDETAILTAVKTAAEEKANTSIGTISETSYPRDIHLPDGAAVLRWIESANEFQPALQTTTLDNINSVSRFAYPASLYYFVDSPIKTSDLEIDFATLCDDKAGGITVEAGKTVWESVVNKSEFSGDEVSSDTKSVAIEKPVQYAVAQLQVEIQASGETLPDATTPVVNDVEIVNPDNSEPSFPLKGVIVCGQRPVNYLFEQESNSDVDVKFIYDSQVKDCNLSTSPVEACNTLVLQSFTGEDVEIILEFENNSNTDFKGVDGTIYRGTRFYLIGKVNHLNPTISDGTNDGRVFTKDYITMVKMTVSSLAKAYNVLPSLLTSNLEIGVETTPKWVAATPTAVVLE